MQALLNRLTADKDKPRIYIVPSRFGFLLGVILLVMLLGAINYSNSMAYLLVFLLVGLGHVCMLYTHRNLAKIELKYCHTEPAFLSHPAKVTLVFSNQSSHDHFQLGLAVKQNCSDKSFLSKWRNAYIHKHTVDFLPAQQSTNAIISIDTAKRGYQNIERLRLSTQFPLGLFYSWLYLKPTSQILVYPKPEGKRPLPMHQSQGEQSLTAHRDGLDDFAGFNNYREGDPPRSIAWKALAKDDVLRTKKFNSAQSGQCTLRWQDTSGDIENRLSQLTQWLLDADKAALSTRLELPNQYIDFGHGNAHLHHCLKAVALYDA
jgi:uncharacterized protein (DUF58 family)